MYALVEIKGRQYRVEADATVTVDRLAEEEGTTVEFPSVVLLNDGEKTTVGSPYVDGASVSATVTGHGRDRKIIVFRYKRRKNFKRTRGHRQHFSTIRVDAITAK